MKETIKKQALLIPGQLWPSEMDTLFSLLKDSRRHIEVGSLCGRSLYVAGHSVQSGARIAVVDPFVFDGMDWIEPWPGFTEGLNRSVRVHLEKMGHDVELHKCVLREFRDQHRDEMCDSVYIDGLHDYLHVFDDLRVAWDLIVPGGVLVGHDYWARHPGVIRAVQEFCLETGVSSETYANGRMWSIRKAQK